MKGKLFIIHPTAPVEVRVLSHQYPFSTYQDLVGGLVEVVPYWDHHVDFDGKMYPAIVLANQEGSMLGLPYNLWATALWHFVAKAKGFKPAQSLTGPVVICIGDEEFLQGVLD